jgi:hypothetical protein
VFQADPNAAIGVFTRIEEHHTRLFACCIENGFVVFIRGMLSALSVRWTVGCQSRLGA